MLVVPKVPRVPMVPWVPMVPVVSMVSMVPIERLCLTSQAVKHPQHSPFYSVSLIRLQGKKVVSSTVTLETQAAWHLPSTSGMLNIVGASLSKQINYE